MKNSIACFCFFLLASLAFSQETPKKIFGTISSDFGVLRDVNISILGKGDGAVSDANGKFEMMAQKGEVLVFSRVGMLPLEIKVEDVTRILNITMYEKTEKLDEVTVTKKIKKDQVLLAIEYNNNPNLIKSTFGILDKETSNYSLRILDETEINVSARDLGAVLNGRFAGVKAQCNNGDLAVSMRTDTGVGGAGSGGAIYDVDGQIFPSLPCNLIDLNNIKRIAVIGSYSGVLRYGNLGKGGVVIINTKTANFSPRDQDGNLIDVARRNDNVYTSKALVTDIEQQNRPNYLQQLYESNDTDDAIARYKELATAYSSSYFFFLDAYTYFSTERKNNEYADAIIVENQTVFADNPVALKSLAFLYQAGRRFEKANAIYREVFILRPDYAQSYLDLADSYQEIGAYQKAAAIYARYGYLLEEGLLIDTTKVFTQIIDRELNNLITLKGKDLLSKQDLKKLTLDEYFEGTRLVFEWADSEAEFELKFVNPQDRYFDWKHSARENADRIKDEKTIGYATEEYLIDDALPGKWQVNINYLGNKSLTPTYLKATVYHNFGRPSQTKETKVFKLSLKNVEQRLFAVNNGR